MNSTLSICNDSLSSHGNEGMGGKQISEDDLDWVRAIAGRLVARLEIPQEFFEDLIAAGYLGLVEAAQRFEPEPGVKFKHFAFLRIRGAMIDALRKRSDLSPRAYRYAKAMHAVLDARQQTSFGNEVASKSGADDICRLLHYAAEGALAFRLSFTELEGSLVSQDSQQDIEERIAQKETAQLLRHVVSSLPRRERQIVEQYYFEGRSFLSIAKEQAVTKSWVSKVHARALGLIRKRYLNRLQPSKSFHAPL